MDRKLFFSILSMDSYNRGYGQGVLGLSSSVRIGSAQIVRQSGVEAGSAGVNAGFYAIAYRWNGETIIAYRGSDNIDKGAAFANALGRFPIWWGTDFNLVATNDDVTNGYGVAFGYPNGPQALLAVEFYRAIAGVNSDPRTRAGNTVSVTGHSLGAGLSGLVADIYNLPGIHFDPMPFGQAADNAFLNAQSDYASNLIHPSAPIQNPFYGSALYHGGAGPWVNGLGAGSAAYAISANGHATQNRLDYWTREHLAFDIGIGVNYLGMPSDVELTATARNQVGQAHANNLIVMTIFGDSLADTNWRTSARYFVPQLFDEAIGEAVGAGLIDNTPNLPQSSGSHDYSGAMRDAIAYSAIDEGERPFGDTGIRALFNDANDLGRALPDLPSIVSGDVRTAISRLVVEFAGLLAVNRVEHSSWGQAVEGVVSFGTNAATGNLTNGFYIDLTDRTWSLDADWQVPHEPLSAGAIVNGLVTAATTTDVVAALGRWLSSTSNGAYQVVSDAVDSIAISLSDGEMFRPSATNRYQMIVGRDAADSHPISGNPAIVLAGNGANTIFGTSGNDALIGGDDFDTFVGGRGDDWFYGGGGSNLLRGGNPDGTGLNDHDTAYYSNIGGTFVVSYRGDSVNNPTTISRTGGTDTLFSIEEIFLGSAQSQVRVIGRIDAATDLTIHNGTGGRSAILPVDFGNGIRFINTAGQGSIYDTVGRGQIHVTGFHTEIITTAYDDEVFDDSSEQKVINAGNGADVVSVAGTTASAVIFGGLGSDTLIGGEAGDRIVDQGPQGAGETEILADWGGGSRYVFGAVAAGGGDDVIVMDLSGYVRPPADPFLGSAPDPTFVIDPGAGNDTVNLVGGLGGFYYTYRQGDGADTVMMHASGMVPYTPGPIPAATEIASQIVQPSIAIDLSQYGSGQIAISFATSSVRIVAEDLPNRDELPLWEFSGDAIITLSDGGQIRLNDVLVYARSSSYDTYYSPPTDVVFSSNSGTPGQVYLAPFGLDTADGGDIPMTMGAAPAPAAQMARGMAMAASAAGLFAEPQAAAVGDQDVSLDMGAASYTGGSGTDRLTITWDMNALTSTLSGTTITISDRWNMIGSVTLTDFDEIYVAEEDRVYSVAEFNTELAQRQAGSAAYGTAGDDVLTGTAARDSLFGLEGADTLTGLAGGDLLDGGIGADTLSGGLGDDRYVIDDAGDVIVENAGEGRDSVTASIDYVLAGNVEDLVLSGSTLAGNGNALGNRLTGNDAANTLSGLGGDDALFGLLGDDALFGGDGDDYLQGGGGNDTLDGGNGSDLLIGGFGADTMTGGAGDDVYYLDDSGDVVVEDMGGGRDTVYSLIADYMVAANVERVVLVDGAISATANNSGTEIIGNALDNTLLGGAGDDRLYGGDGADQLTGGLGADVLEGGSGNDTLSGGGGDDVLIGGDGLDTLVNGDGNDLMVGAGQASMADVGQAVSAPNWTSAEGATDVATFSGVRSDYAITALGNGWFRFEHQTANGLETDHLVNVGTVIFDDGNGNREVFSLAGPSASAGSAALALTEDQAFASPVDATWFTDPNGETPSLSLTLQGGDPAPSWLQLVNGQIVGTPPADFDGQILVDLVATTTTGTAHKSITLTFAGINDAPVVTGVMAGQTANENAAFSLALPDALFTDVDTGDSLNIAVTQGDGSPLPAWLHYNAFTQTLSGTPTTSDVGALSISVTATDLAGASASTAFSLTVNNVNDPPTVDLGVADIAVDEDSPVNFLVPAQAFRDVDGDALTLTATLVDGSPLPSWLTFDGTRFTGTPPSNFNGSYLIALTANDGLAAVATTFALAITPVNDAPALAVPLPDVSGAEDTAFNFGLPAGSFSDVDNANLGYSAALVDGSALPEWLNFDPATQVFSGTPPLNFNGFVDVRVTASDGTLSATDDFRLAIAAVNDAPVTANIDGTAQAGSAATGTISASDIDGDALTFALASGPSHGTASINAATGAYIYTPVAGYSGADSFAVTVLDGNGGTVTANVSYTVTSSVTAINGTVGNDTLLGTPGSDLINGLGGADNIYAAAGDDTVDGGDGNDTITGDAGNDTLTGGNGNDSIYGGIGNDIIDAGAGDDTVTGDAGDDTIAGGIGLDRLYGGDGNDTIGGGAGNDIMTGDAGADVLSGNDGNDQVYGGDGNDLIDGGAGADTLTGDNGDDVLTPGSGNDMVYAGAGIDRLSYAGSNSAWTINLATSIATSGAETDRVYDFENAEGGLGNDAIIGTPGANVLDGGAGNDVLTGGAGNDTLIGGVGADIAVFSGVQSTYSIITSGGVVSIRDNAPTSDGNDGTDVVAGVETVQFKGGVQVGIASPIVLDLDGDGVTLIDNRESGVGFDWDGNGIANQTGWIGGGDGFLVIDRDGNGTVSGADELSFTGDKPDAKSDLDGLRAFDSNGDGILSALDDQFASFRVWRDGNGNGTADSGEVLSLEGAGVSSINLAGQAVDRSWAWGENITVNTGSFMRTDGTQAAFGDVALSYESSLRRGHTWSYHQRPNTDARHDWLASDHVLREWAPAAEFAAQSNTPFNHQPFSVPFDSGDVASIRSAVVQAGQESSHLLQNGEFDDMMLRPDLTFAAGHIVWL